MKKYYLLRYGFFGSIGGYNDDIDILDISYEREPLVERVRDALEDEDITHINGYEVDEFEFDENEFKWSIDYEPSGMVMREGATYKILEREE